MDKIIPWPDTGHSEAWHWEVWGGGGGLALQAGDIISDRRVAPAHTPQQGRRL